MTLTPLIADLPFRNAAAWLRSLCFIQRCHSARRITLGLLAIALMLDSSRNRCLSGHIPGRNKLSGVHSDCPSRFFSPLILCVFYCDGRSVTNLRS